MSRRTRDVMDAIDSMRRLPDLSGMDEFKIGYAECVGGQTPFARPMLDSRHTSPVLPVHDAAMDADPCGPSPVAPVIGGSVLSHGEVSALRAHYTEYGWWVTSDSPVNPTGT